MFTDDDTLIVGFGLKKRWPVELYQCVSGRFDPNGMMYPLWDLRAEDEPE
jgi:hypothetical protein